MEKVPLFAKPKERRMLRKIWEWIKHPHGWMLIPFYIFTAICIAIAIVLTVVGLGTSYGFVAYIFYALAALALGYTVYTVVIFAPKIKHKIKDKLKANKFMANVLENYDFKTTVFALVSFVITIAFAIMNLVSAIHYQLFWYGAIAAYYFVLIFFRGGILYAYKKCARKYADNAEEYEKCKWKIYLASGAFLILLEFAMIAAVTQMIMSERPTQSGQIMAIANATYTFYKIIMSAYNLVKSRKTTNPVTRALRNLNFADSCMSIVSLTVLMIATFDGTDSNTVMLVIKATVGFAACAVIIAIAALMIIRANKVLRLQKGGSVNEQ